MNHAGSRRFEATTRLVSRESHGPFPREEDGKEQTHVHDVASVICHDVTRRVSCTIEELVLRLPANSRPQVFAAVDRLSRQGTLTLSRTRSFGYVVSIGSAAPTPQSLEDRKCQALFGRVG
jgi:hypothetical protein